MRVLSPAEIDQLTRMLTRSLDLSQLRRFIHRATGEQLEDVYVAPDLPLRDKIFQLLLKLEKEPITDQFLDVVYREKPFQFELRAFIATIYPEIAAGEPFARRAYSVQERGQLAAAGPVPALERVVKGRLGNHDLRVWLDKMLALERQVCRIEAKGGALGTGFLVGPGAVLTNWHVVKEARDNGVEQHLACRFDFRRMSNGGVDGGKLVKSAMVRDERPCSPAELSNDPDQQPQARELDYALLELAEPQPERGYIRIAKPAPIAANDPLVIVQHPDGQEMRFAVDTEAVEGLVHDGLRLRYTTNTDAGSSGSPCLTMNLDIVALHHLGDPRFGQAKYNQGIPIGLIHQSISETAAAAAMLGA